MNVYGKRPRLYSSHQRDFPKSFVNPNEYYDELAIDEEEEDEEEQYDPHTELQQRRSELDHRLKNTFEDIFAKYERDFDGIGDEIDLATGEIVVNNGHLVEMLDERDAGLRKARREVVEDSEGPEFSEEEDGSLEDEEDDAENDGEELEEEEDDDEDDEQDEEEDTTTGESMDDDDLILRGFAQANRFLQASPELGLPEENYDHPPIPRAEPKSKPRRSLDALPTHSDILAQFGPQLGPQIVGYIAQQEKARESHIEPAWRVPDIPSAPPKRRPTHPPSARPREMQRSASPETSHSIWAVPGSRKQKKSRPSGMALDGSPQVKRARNGFTQEEDEAMLGYITKARQNGTPLSSTLLWKGIAAKYPRHSWQGWQGRYKRNFFLSTDSDASVTDTMTKEDVASTRKPQSNRPQHQSDRPNRERKPAQRDSRIISWSEAVDTIASVDPDLHAGILDDARRARNGEVSWVFGRPEEPIRSKALHHGPSPRRPVSAGEIDELQRDYGYSSREPGKNPSSDRMPVLGYSGAQRHMKKPASITRTSCPHEDCSHLKVHKYRLERADGEDVSEMALHLLRDHHTTSFPCGEDDCLQKGERGYFTPNDLVKHVKAAHPDTEALLRLRGRVDPILLGEDEGRVCIDLTQESPQSERKVRVSVEKESDFLYNRNLPSNNTILSPASGHDRTITPATFGSRFAGEASNSTPLTSFSSLAVNRSPVTAQRRREISDSQEPQLPSEQDIPLPTLTSTRNESLEPGFPSSRMNSFGPNSFPRSWSKGPTSEPNHLLGLSSDPFLPLAADTDVELASTGRSLHDVSERPSPYLEPQPNIRHSMAVNSQSFSEEINSMVTQKQPFSIPSKSAAKPPSPNNAIPTSSGLSKSKTINVPKKSRTSESFTRNIIHPSHEFSDEEGPMPPPKITRPAPPAPVVLSSTPVVEIFKRPSVLPVTPTIKKKAPKQAIQRVAEQYDDLDELSLGPDDFKLISSHTKSTPQVAFGTYMGIKREKTAGPSFPSGTTSRKRRFSDIARDDVDELGADECFGKSTGTHKRIKKEIDLNGTPMVHRVKAQRKQAKKLHREELKKGHMGMPLPLGSVLASRQTGRSGTPLLDLTPDRRRVYSLGDREVFDSDDSIPSSGLREEFLRSTADSVARTPYDGLLTPSRSKQGSLDPLKLAKTAVVVKTPGGTLRKCGVGSFRCGRTFCFRCGHSDDMVLN